MRNLKRPLSALCSVVLFLTPLAVSPPAYAFTQSGATTFMGSGIPMGHEWLTRRAAIELLLGPNNDPVVPKDPKDPRYNPTTWTQGMAHNLDLSSAQSEVKRIKGLTYNDPRYASTYKPIFDSIIGERWVDLGGFNVTSSTLGSYNCFDAVAQEPVEIQYDHFMRQYNDSGNAGGVNAATQSQKRFINYFVAAAMAPPTQILVWDGGGYAAQYTVDRNYFLMGRAAHLFQDSFSLEHTVRRYAALPRLGQDGRLVSEDDGDAGGRFRGQRFAEVGDELLLAGELAGRRVGDAGDPEIAQRDAFVHEQADAAAFEALVHGERVAVHLVIAEDGVERDVRCERARAVEELGDEVRIVVDEIAGDQHGVGPQCVGRREDPRDPRRAREEADVEIAHQHEPHRPREVRDADRHALDA